MALIYEFLLPLGLLTVGTYAQGPATRLVFNDPNGTLGDSVAAGGWKDYYVVAEDETSNIYFSVTTPSTRMDALSTYVYDGELPPLDKRTEAGAYLDVDESSRTGRYTSVIGQCYVEKGTKYFLSVKGRTPKAGETAGEEGIPDHFPFVVSAKLVPAQLSANVTVKGSMCDMRYLHYFYEVPSGGLGRHLQATVKKTSGDLDSIFLRYEKCAGPAGSNLQRISVEGHGVPKGVAYYPEPRTELLPGRYYISIKGKHEECGKYDLNVIEFSTAWTRLPWTFLSMAFSLLTIFASAKLGQ